jgi:predicted dehydrogenase
MPSVERQDMIGIGLIGYGYWGPKVLRALASTAGCRVVMVGDLRSERLQVAQGRPPGDRRQP